MGGALLTVLLQKLCPHRFSWPHSVHGQDYQVCLICGSTYEYDWQTMRRVRRLNVAPSHGTDLQAGLQHGD